MSKVQATTLCNFQIPKLQSLFNLSSNPIGSVAGSETKSAFIEIGRKKQAAEV
jgi:hypothetical protein